MPLTAMKLVRALSLAFVLCAIPAVSGAKDKHHSPYASQQHRQIKALSAADVKTLLSGGGWGFAKAAELNGWPGPLHVLELADKLNLSADQASQVRDVFHVMRKKAKHLGAQLVMLEQKLDRLFARKSVTAEKLARVTADIGAVRARLRAVHLQAHLKTPQILSAAQIKLYNRFRGYSAAHQKKHGKNRHQHRHH